MNNSETRSIKEMIDDGDRQKPYSNQDYEKARKKGLDLDDWHDYIEYYELGEKPNYDCM